MEWKDLKDTARNRAILYIKPICAPDLKIRLKIQATRFSEVNCLIGSEDTLEVFDVLQNNHYQLTHNMVRYCVCVL